MKMVDKELLEAIGQMMEAQEKRLAEAMDAQGKRISDAVDTKLAQQKAELLKESAHSMKVLLDSEIKPQFNLLAEQVQLLEEKIDGLAPVDSVYADIYAMKAAIRTINKEIKELKQAQ